MRDVPERWSLAFVPSRWSLAVVLRTNAMQNPLGIHLSTDALLKPFFCHFGWAFCSPSWYVSGFGGTCSKFFSTAQNLPKTSPHLNKSPHSYRLMPGFTYGVQRHPHGGLGDVELHCSWRLRWSHEAKCACRAGLDMGATRNGLPT